MPPATAREKSQRLRQQLTDDETVRQMINQRAYEIFQSRGQEHGHDREDWLQAEREILHELAEKELQGRLEAAQTDFPPDQDQTSDYRSSATKPQAPPAQVGPSSPAPTERLSTPPESSAVVLPASKPSKKDRETKHSSRKQKKTAEAKDPELIAALQPKSKDKKSAGKSRAGKKKEKKSKKD